MATHYGTFTLFKRLALDNEAVNSFQCGPGDLFPVNARDEAFPLVYLEQEQITSAVNALDRRTVAFWVLDRTFSDNADTADAQARVLSKCEQVGRSMIARLADLYPDVVPEPLAYSTAAVPQTGADRCFGYRFEIALDFTYELDVCLIPYEDAEPGEFSNEFSNEFA